MSDDYYKPYMPDKLIEEADCDHPEGPCVSIPYKDILEAKKLLAFYKRCMAQFDVKDTTFLWVRFELDDGDCANYKAQNMANVKHILKLFLCSHVDNPSYLPFFGPTVKVEKLHKVVYEFTPVSKKRKVDEEEEAEKK